MNQVKIALLGVSGVGKDFITEIFVKDFNYHRFSFSDQLKKLATMIYPWMERDYPPELKEKPLNYTVPQTGEVITKTPREIWLNLNHLRFAEDGLFVRMLEHQVSMTVVEKLIISDIRTQNEYDWCVKNGFTIVMIHSENPIHPANSFDDFVRSVYEDGRYDYIFENEFKGKESVKTFIESCFEGGQNV